MAEDERLNEKQSSWWLSDGLLGGLVVVMTVVTAFAAYQGNLTGIDGDDFDFNAQKALVLATASFQSGNSELLEDLYTYDSYRFFTDLDQEEAAVYLDRASEPLRSAMERPDDPFDEAYLEARYSEAFDLLAEAEEFEEKANLADEKSKKFELAGFVFAIGLSAAAWASLVGTGRQIRAIFLIVALCSLVAGLTIIVQIVFI